MYTAKAVVSSKNNHITDTANIVASIYPLAVLPVQHVQHLKYIPQTEHSCYVKYQMLLWGSVHLYHQ